MESKKCYSICLGRQLGSGGSEIAKYIAEQLGFRFYDRELLYAAAAKSGYDRKLFEKSDEEKSELHTFFTNLIPFISSTDYYGNQVDEDSLFRILSETIRSIANEENCLFVGRCAEYILRDHKNTMFSVFISADSEARIHRLCEMRKIKVEAAHKLIQTNDKRRSAFHDFYSTHQWGKASTYDMCLNTSRIGVDEAKKLILEYARRRFNIE